jgi:molybdate/tungstate transport system substrate-binding protein
VVGIGIGFALGYYVSHPAASTNQKLVVYAAGSTRYVLGDQFSPAFKNLTGISSGITFGGSVSNAVTVKTGVASDVFVSAAAGVIPQYLMPNFTKWMVIFATNEMAITWNNSAYAITGPYWFENLSKPGVIVAVSNSSLDPSGFQAIETIKLAGILYTEWNNSYVKEAFNNDYAQFHRYNQAWNTWFNVTLPSEKAGPGYPVNDSMALYDQLFLYKWTTSPQQLVLSTVEIDLNGYLNTGAANYALTYKSQALNQHLQYYENGSGGNGLSSWINLGSIAPDHVAFYSLVNTSGPKESNIGNYPGSPILYAATILSDSKNVGEAQQFIYYLISSLGTSTLKASDFDPIAVPFVYSSDSETPSFLAGLTQQVPAYIPPTSYEQI